MTRIKDLRRARGETQESLAALIGITRGAYANIENGKREPDIKTMTVLANHFDVTIDQLLGRETAEEKPASISADGQSDKLAKALDSVGINVDTLSEAEINKIAQLAKVALES